MNEPANEVLLFSTQVFLGDLLRHQQLIISWRRHREKIVVTNLSMELSSSGVCYNQVLVHFTADTIMQFMKYQIASHNEFREEKGRISDSPSTTKKLCKMLTRVCTLRGLHAGLW